MDNKIKKILGWFLLAVGILIIFCDLYFSFNIFTARASAPLVFGEAAAEKSQSNSQDLNTIISQQMLKMIPVGHISKIMNLISWSAFAGILVLIGGKLASIGINLLREKTIQG